MSLGFIFFLIGTATFAGYVYGQTGKTPKDPKSTFLRAMGGAMLSNYLPRLLFQIKLVSSGAAVLMMLPLAMISLFFLGWSAMPYLKAIREQRQGNNS